MNFRFLRGKYADIEGELHILRQMNKDMTHTTEDQPEIVATEKVHKNGLDNLSYILDEKEYSRKETLNMDLSKSTINENKTSFAKSTNEKTRVEISLCNVFLLPNVARRFGLIIMLFIIASFSGNEVIRVNVSRVLSETGLSINKDVSEQC